MPQGPRFFSTEDEGNNIAVWDIKTGHLLRTFPSILPEGEGAKKQMAWPALKWSADDKYTARLTPGQQISVYELPGMGLQGKKSLKIEGVVDFEWCPHGEKEREDVAKASKKPTENMLAYWTPEVANQPARVTLLDFPGRTVLRQKNLFNVSEVGDISKACFSGQFMVLTPLCSVGFIGKIRATFSVYASIDTQRQKDLFSATSRFSVCVRRTFPLKLSSSKVRYMSVVPTSGWYLTRKRTDTVTDFSWEPKGERFAIVSSSDPNLGNPGSGVTIKTDISFYQLDHSKNDFKLLRASTGFNYELGLNTNRAIQGTLAGRTTNTIRWSPRGRHVVLATVGSTSKSELEFWDLDFNSDDVVKKEVPKEEWGSSIQQLGVADHYGVTDVEWDPSGRYLATVASAWTHTVCLSPKPHTTFCWGTHRFSPLDR
jgi:translation initiation factor 3 subunit B